MQNSEKFFRFRRLMLFSMLAACFCSNRLAAQDDHKFVTWEQLEAPSLRQVVSIDDLLFGRSDSSLYKSANLGNTWNVIETDFASELILKLDADGETLYVMTTRRICKTSDRGESFENVFGGISRLDWFRDMDFEKGTGWFNISNWSTSYGGPNKIIPGRSRMMVNGDLPEGYRGVVSRIIVDKLAPDSVAYTYGYRGDSKWKYFKTLNCGENWVEYNSAIGRVLFSTVINDTSFVFTRNQYSKDRGETWHDLAFCAGTFFETGEENRLLIAGEHGGVHLGPIDAFRPIGLRDKSIISLAMVGKSIFAISRDSSVYRTDTPEFDSGNMLIQAENWSKTTSCAEEDNINIPLFAEESRPFIITATHPKYEIIKDSCAADFSGCNCWILPSNSLASFETCTKLYDDGMYIVELCRETNWWLGTDMELQIDDKKERGHRLVIYKKIPGKDSYPQFFVLYQDGNLRLIPHPPDGVESVCFGSSVIVGPAEVESNRPFAAIEKVAVNIAETSLDIVYQSGDSAKIQFEVDSLRARVFVTPFYDPTKPFATFRSMFVSDSVNDVSHITVADTSLPILGDWLALNEMEWLFERKKTSFHNTSSPDIFIEIPTKVGVERDATRMPNIFTLYQNYPNPFNPETTIRFTLQKKAHVQLKIFNILGEEIAILADEIMGPGEKKIEWNGKNFGGTDVPSGVYIYFIEAENSKKSRKMVLVR